MNHGKSTDTAILLGGALLGAAAMYVLDPEAGARRRRRLADGAENAYAEARHAVSGAMESVAGSAREVSSRLSSHAGDERRSARGYAGDLAAEAQAIAADLAHRAKGVLPDTGDAGRHLGGNWLDRARQLGGKLHSSLQGHAHRLHDDAAEHAGGLRDWATHRAAQARKQVHSWIGHEEPAGFGMGTLLSSTAGCLAVGAGLMYFLDPHRGRTRRAWIADKTSQCIHKTGRTLRATGRDLSNRFHGVAHETASAARTYVSEQRVDSEQLIQRIRSEVGHLSAHPGNVQFMADATGAVMVTGNIARDELDRLLALLHRVPGVTHVINRLHVSEAHQSEVAPQIRSHQ